MPRPSSREAILEAAEAIVVESGALRMTLDAVAERAGVSKGGLMYNYPTKEALLEAMLARMDDHYEQLRDQARKKLSSGEYNELMVEIRALQGKSGADIRLSAALLAVVANQPELMSVIQKSLQDRFFNKIASKRNYERSSILFFALMGLHFHDLLNLSLLNQRQKKKVFDELFRLACCDEEI